MTKWRSGTVMVVLAAMAASQPAQACWNNDAVQAAKIMNLNNLMMVSALRCRKGQHNFLKEYNSFVKINAGNLSIQHGIVKRHFTRTKGAKRASLALDKFNIGLANSFGAGHRSMGCAELKSLAKDISANRNSAASLAALAERTAGMPDLPGGSCKRQIASRN